MKNNNEILRVIGFAFFGVSACTFALGVFFLLLALEQSWVSIIIFALCAVYLLVGTICYLAYKIPINKRNTFMSNNSFVMADIDDIDINIHRKVSVDRITMNPYFIWCSYTDGDGKVYKFKSKQLLYNPSGLLKSNKIKVYVDLAQPNKYLVDTNSILPEDAMLHKFKFDSKRNSRELTSGGKYILAETCGIEILGRIIVNGCFKPTALKLPKGLADKVHLGVDDRGRAYFGYSVLCKCVDSKGVIHIFASKGVWGEPDREYMGDIVKVYYKGNNYRYYHVDLTSIS